MGHVIQRLVRADVPNRDSLVETLIAENREAAKFRYAEVKADESIPLEERQRWGAPLTDEEIAALRAGGITVDKEIPPDKSPLLQGYRQIADLLIGSLTVEQAADRLGISVNEVRELAESRQLYTVDAKFDLNRFPAFQFTDDGLLPGFVRSRHPYRLGRPWLLLRAFFSWTMSISTSTTTWIIPSVPSNGSEAVVILKP